MKFEGRQGHVARILVSVYVPCHTSRGSGDLTVFSQQRRQLDHMRIEGCPRDVLLEDVRAKLLEWRQNGERIVVFIDANENMTCGKFHSMLSGPDLGLREAVSSRHPDPRWTHTGTYSKGPYTGQHPIDGVYVSPDLPICAATWLQIIPALGDHRFAVIDIHAQALVGDNKIKIVRPPARRLSSAIPSAVKNLSLIHI